MFHQIYIMALITTALAFLAIGGFLKWKSPKEEHKFLLLLVLLELPMCAIAYYLVRIPLLDGLVQLLISKDSSVYRFITIFYAPLTEESAKIWLLLFPFVRRQITKDNFWRAAMALGLGFGIGEIWVVGNFAAQSPQYASLLWYMFTGFLNERFMVCLLHGVFTAAALFYYTKGKFIIGFLLAMLLHFIGNFPIYLMWINLGGLGKDAWMIILAVWVPLYFIGGLFLLTYLASGGIKLGQFIFGNSVCPECSFEYPSPLWGINLLNKRYERCPNCKKWHIVTRFNKPEDKR